MSNTHTNLTALVTGASSGIGEVYARRLATMGYHLTLVARRKDRLEALAASLTAQYGITAKVLVADLGTREGIAAVEADLKANPPHFLLNNAGYGDYKPLAASDADLLEDLITVNITALMRLTHAALPGMLARGNGTVVNVASGLAFGPHPTRSVYSGAKVFVVNFSQSLAAEVGPQGIQVQVLCPGITDTEFHQRSGTDLTKIPANWVMKTEDVVTGSLAGLKLGEVVCIPGLPDNAALDAYITARNEVFTQMAQNNHQLAARYQG